MNADNLAGPYPPNIVPLAAQPEAQPEAQDEYPSVKQKRLLGEARAVLAAAKGAKP